jgi:glycine/D-amino acid oxidase-like deaminating enzyme
MKGDRGLYIEGPDVPLPDSNYDYVIVGAGIYGLPLAYFLRKLKSGARVLVVEDNTIPGQGITVNTGGIIRACYSSPGVMVSSAFGRPYFADPTRTMALRKHVHTGFVPAGWGRFVNERETPGIRDEIVRIAHSAQQLGIGGIWTADIATYLDKVGPARKANLAKVFHASDVTHVLVDDNGGYADGGTALLAFLEAALDAGADVARLSTVTGLVREAGAVRGVRYRRWRSRSDGDGGTVRETTVEGEIRCGAVIVAAGAGSRRLLERELGVRMPTFPTYHQTPMVENTAEVGFSRTSFPREVASEDGSVETREVITADLPVISHWRDLYFHSEGMGLTVGAHHRELHSEDHVPRGGKIALDDTTVEVGLSQVLLDKILDNLDHFPVLASQALRLGKRPEDVPGGFYIMNPEELPFEGPVPDAGGLFYIGSGSGTGFKLGPGLSYLLAQRLTGVPQSERLIQDDTLSVERNRYFFPADTTDEQLRALFDPASGRFRNVGASGVGSGSLTETAASPD